MMIIIASVMDRAHPKWTGVGGLDKKNNIHYSLQQQQEQQQQQAKRTKE